jgi:hypothetical protein
MNSSQYWTATRGPCSSLAASLTEAIFVAVSVEHLSISFIGRRTASRRRRQCRCCGAEPRGSATQRGSDDAIRRPVSSLHVTCGPAGRKLGDDHGKTASLHPLRPTPTHPLTCGFPNPAGHARGLNCLRDEEAVGSNPATPTGATAGGGRSSDQEDRPPAEQLQRVAGNSRPAAERARPHPSLPSHDHGDGPPDDVLGLLTLPYRDESGSRSACPGAFESRACRRGRPATPHRLRPGCGRTDEFWPEEESALPERYPRRHPTARRHHVHQQQRPAARR